MTTLANNIEATRSKMREFEKAYHRQAESVHLLAVSKRQGVEKIRQAFAAGCTDFGENYLQEALKKMKELKDLPLVWHFIGPLQSNKTRAIAEHFHWVHSIDREKLASRLNEQKSEHGTPLNVCVQINLSNEASKSGIPLNQAGELCHYVNQLPHLTLRGLMAIPSPLDDLSSQRSCFQPIHQEFERLQLKYPSMDTLSIGMSADFEAAIAEGSTLIRIGTSLFGTRD